MKKLGFGILALILAALLAYPWLLWRGEEVRRRARQQAARLELAQIEQMAAENGRLSNALARSGSSRAAAEGPSAELLKLRNEYGQLRGMLKEMEQLRGKVQELRSRLQDAEKELDGGSDNFTGLLADEMPKRQARLARLKRWLEGMPQEMVPELQYLSQEAWIKRVDDPLVTDDDYRRAISFLRADADHQFARILWPALKQYAGANNGQFPTDLAQLEPYFASPVSDAVLQRYQIVAANSLVSSLAEVGGDWLITEKAPVNKDLDQRMAIGLAGGNQCIQRGRWDPVP
jgi:hypothetical protein